MWIVRIALRRPYTFVVMSMLIVILGVATILRMPTDIFPDIDIPVISVVWNYTGLPPEEMEKRIVTGYERGLTTTVNDIEHIESQSLTGIAVIKIFFQPGAHIDAATAQVTAISQTVLRQMPPGTTPPFIIRYSASNVPIVQIALQSDSLSEQQLFDYGTNFMRADISAIPGAMLPWPYGGKQRQVMIDIDSPRLYAWGLSPHDVTTAVAAQNAILPTGTAKMGTNEYPVLMNSSPEAIREIGDLPIKTVGTTTIYVRDIANVRDGYAPQTSMVHVEGNRSVLMSVLKNGSASTLDVVAKLRALVPLMAAKLPKELKITLLFDQSVFVRAAVEGVVKEAAIAAGLTALMILLFLGSWRATLVVVISIPLSILVSIIALYALGQTLNVMTLGGLALAVGILVDDATVEIENIHRNLGQRKPLIRAILDGAQEIAVPAFVSTLCICIVFIPVALITGAARSLFVPLAMAVVFAMLTSYLLSRTLVPTLVRYLLRSEAHRYAEGQHGPAGHGLAARFFHAFDSGFNRMRMWYGGWLGLVLERRGLFVAGFACFVALSLSLFPLVGRDFFPTVDAGTIKLHVRGPAGTRIEETEQRVSRIEETIRGVIPPAETETMLDILGTPYSGLNLSLSEGALISPADGQILISLKEHHAPTPGYVRKLRKLLAQEYPDTTFFFLAPDISTQVLNFGLAAPIDVQLVGAPGDDEAAYAVAQEIAAKVRAIPGAVDVHLAQVRSQPELLINVDRTMAGGFGLTQTDVASDVLVSLSSSTQVLPNYWLDTQRSVQYLVAIQTPQYANDSIRALDSTPVSLGHRRLAAAPLQHGPGDAHHRGGERDPLQRPAHLRRPGQRGRGRPRVRVRRGRARRRGDASHPAPRLRGAGEGAGGEHELLVPRPRRGARLRGRARLPLDGGELPVLAGPLRHPHGAPGRALGHRLDALSLGHDAQRPGADGLHHVRRRGHGQQHPGGDLRQRAAGERPRARAAHRPPGRAPRRDDPATPGHHDRARHDHRHAPHVPRPR